MQAGGGGRDRKGRRLFGALRVAALLGALVLAWGAADRAKHAPPPELAPLRLASGA